MTVEAARKGRGAFCAGVIQAFARGFWSRNAPLSRARLLAEMCRNGWCCCARWEEVLHVEQGGEGGHKDQAGGIRVGVHLLDWVGGGGICLEESHVTGAPWEGRRDGGSGGWVLGSQAAQGLRGKRTLKWSPAEKEVRRQQGRTLPQRMKAHLGRGLGGRLSFSHRRPFSSLCCFWSALPVLCPPKAELPVCALPTSRLLLQCSLPPAPPHKCQKGSPPPVPPGQGKSKTFLLAILPREWINP